MTTEIREAAQALIAAYENDMTILDNDVIVHVDTLASNAARIIAMMDALQSFIDAYGPARDGDEDLNGGDTVDNVMGFVDDFRKVVQS